MRTIEPDMIPAMAEALRDYPANGKPDMQIEVNQWLGEFGLIEEAQTWKSCKTCGHQSIDWRYYRITPAGRLFMAASGWAL